MSNRDRVKSAQPNLEVWDFENHWSRDMSDCCVDCGTCCFACFCPMCFVNIFKITIYKFFNHIFLARKAFHENKRMLLHVVHAWWSYESENKIKDWF